MDYTLIKDVLQYLIQGGTLVTMIILVIKSIRMFPHEERGAKLTNKEKLADVADTMEQVAERAASRVLKQQSQIDVLTDEVHTLRQLREVVDALTDELDVLKCEIENYQIENAALREWAEELVGQLREAKIVPASLKPYSKKKCGGTNV